MALVFVSGESANCNVDLPESDGEPVHRGVPRHGHPSQPHSHACSSHIVSAFCRLPSGLPTSELPTGRQS